MYYADVMDKLATLIQSLGDKDLAVLQLLDDFHYAYGSQLQRLYFTTGTATAMTRSRNRLLARLTDAKLIHRYPRRRFPGNPFEHIYTLAYVGQRVMNKIRGFERPMLSLARTTNHFEHVLEVTELHVQLNELDHSGAIRLLASEAEPTCHRPYTAYRVLKPDYYVKYRAKRDGRLFEDQWFVEIERSRQGAASTLAKVHAYTTYMKLLSASQVMPRVLFVCYSEAHRAHLERLLDRNVEQHNRDLFAAVLNTNTLGFIVPSAA